MPHPQTPSAPCNEMLCEVLQANGSIESPKVVAAFRATDRATFLQPLDPAAATHVGDQYGSMIG